jgi:signal transduction histidine kinase/ActR/RegA family two-component response regulator
MVLQGQPAGALVVFPQITERHRRQAEAVEDGNVRAQSEDERQRMMGCLIEADQRKTEFLATLAHELRHPLAPIRNGLALLRMQGCSIDAAPVVKMMERQVSHMARLIDELLDIARITSGKVELKKQRVALSSVIASTIETSLPLIEAMQHDLVIDIRDDSLMLDADPTRLVQVLVNLLSNAAKYTPDGGRIAISARREGTQAMISVADNGVGIPGKSLGSVFDMFSQAAPNMHLAQGGLGIGLALVRQMVELHGGAVSAASPGAGHGSTITVRLPLAGVSLENAPIVGAVVPSEDILAAPARGLRILVVDDHAESARSLAAVLEFKGHGHVVAVANEGRQALALARQFKPEVAFLDIDMPGMDGYEVAQALRQVGGLEKLVLVALTGWGGPRGKARSQTAGFDHHLAKPTELGAIDALLSGIAASPEPVTDSPETAQ